MAFNDVTCSKLYMVSGLQPIQCFMPFSSARTCMVAINMKVRDPESSFPTPKGLCGPLSHAPRIFIWQLVVEGDMHQGLLSTELPSSLMMHQRL